MNMIGERLIRWVNYLKYRADEVVILEADNTKTMHWYVDAEYAVYKVFKHHTGAVRTMRSKAGISMFTRQKVNACISTEAEIVTLDDIIAKIL